MIQPANVSALPLLRLLPGIFTTSGSHSLSFALGPQKTNPWGLRSARSALHGIHVKARTMNHESLAGTRTPGFNGQLASGEAKENQEGTPPPKQQEVDVEVEVGWWTLAPFFVVLGLTLAALRPYLINHRPAPSVWDARTACPVWALHDDTPAGVKYIPTSYP